VFISYARYVVRRSFVRIIIAVIVLTSSTGCGKSESVATSVPPTDMPVSPTVAVVLLTVAPSSSSGGGLIAFASLEGDYANVYIVNSDGSGRRQLTDTDAHNFYPRWSPDGTRIAFLSTRDGGAEEIYVMDSDGSNQRRLTTNDAFDGAPSWSPDGTQLVFASDRDANHEIYVMTVPGGTDSDGANVRRLTNNSSADRKPAWRPAE
jgi:Tol biopolymer transport system component